MLFSTLNNQERAYYALFNWFLELKTVEGKSIYLANKEYK
jgi:hypothetical protein